MYLSIMYERRFNMWVILGGFRSWGHPIILLSLQKAGGQANGRLGTLMQNVQKIDS